MQRLIRSNFGFVLQGQSNVVEAMQEAMSDERIQRKARAEFLTVPDFTLLQINAELVILDLLRSPHDGRNFGIGQLDSQEPVFGRIVGENVGKRRRNHRPEPKVHESPNRMFPRRSTPEILSRHQYACSRIARFVQHKVGILRSISPKAPVIEDKLSESGLFNPLQKLLGNDLISIDVNAVQRRHAPAVYPKWFHFLISFESVILRRTGEVRAEGSKAWHQSPAESLGERNLGVQEPSH